MKSAKSVEKLKLLEALFVLWIIKNHWLYFVCLFVCPISLAQANVMRIFGFCLKTILISCITENVSICFLNGKTYFVWATKFYVYFLRCMLKIVLSTVFVRLFDLCWTTIFFFFRRSIGISVAFDTENIAKSHFLHTHTGCFLCVVTTNMDESNNGACIRTKHTVSYPIGSFCYSVYQFDFTNSPIRFCHLARKWCAQHIVCRSNDFFVFFFFLALLSSMHVCAGP